MASRAIKAICHEKESIAGEASEPAPAIAVCPMDMSSQPQMRPGSKASRTVAGKIDSFGESCSHQWPFSRRVIK